MSPVVGGILILSLALILWACWVNRPKAEVTTIEAESVPSDYRTNFVNNVARILLYWYSGMVYGEPNVYTSDDLSTAYIEVSTENGQTMVAINWDRNRIDMEYTYHDCSRGEHLEHVRGKARIHRDLVPADKIANFAKKARQIELNLNQPFQDLLDELADKAVGVIATNEDADEMIAYCLVVLTGYLRDHRSAAVAAVVSELIALSRTRDRDAFLKALERCTPKKPDEN